MLQYNAARIPTQHDRDQSLNRRCAICGDLDGTTQLGDFKSTVQSAENGCAGCEVVSRVLTEVYGPCSSVRMIYWTFESICLHTNLHLRSSSASSDLNTWDLIALSDLFFESFKGMSLELFTTTGWSEAVSHYAGSQKLIYQEDTCPFPRLRGAVYPSMNTASEQAFENLRGWIRECSASHEPCQRIPRASKLPTRVVEIAGSKRVKLHLSSGEEDLYTCLSHCWGDEPVIRTTRVSLTTHQNSIPWTGLPKTFQDAIDATSRLGIKYIWIDSLCIIQDDPDDWRHEGSHMCDIYSKAYLTIAASKSKDGTGGCYAAADTPCNSVHWLVNAKGERYNVQTRKCMVHVDDKRDFESEYQAPFPLIDRAWVFQERLLSPRVVHFGPVEMYWECRVGETCECSGWRQSDVSGGRDNIKQRLLTATTVREQRRLWNRVVEEYTRKNLRYDIDIFPALQGIAKSLQWKNDYHAGIWNTEEVVLSLLWYTRDWVRPTVWRAPTWSWASVKGRISFYDMSDLNDLASVISIQTTPLGLDPFGQVLSGQLKLKGFCIEAYYGPNEWNGIICVRAPSVTYPRIGEQGEYIRYPEPVESENGFVMVRSDCWDGGCPKNVKIMAMARGTMYDGGVCIVCLLFERAGFEGEEEVYRRVGTTELENDAGTFEKFGGKEPVVLTII